MKDLDRLVVEVEGEVMIRETDVDNHLL